MKHSSYFVAYFQSIYIHFITLIVTASKNFGLVKEDKLPEIFICFRLIQFIPSESDTIVQSILRCIYSWSFAEIQFRRSVHTERFTQKELSYSPASKETNESFP